MEIIDLPFPDLEISDAMHVEIIGSEDSADNLDKSIAAVKFIHNDATSMTLQIDFSDISAISNDMLESDMLRVTFLKPGLFCARKNREYLSIESWVQEKNVPPQYSVDEFKEMQEAAKKVTIAAKIYTLIEIICFFVL